VKASDFKYNSHRNSYTGLNEVYFWTITIHQWQHVLKPDENKMSVINSLQCVVQNFTTARFYEEKENKLGILIHFGEVCLTEDVAGGD
jgi:hypothetical protein